jgi:hypothetical protein
MSTARDVHWKDGEMWLGYFEKFPDRTVTRREPTANSARQLTMFF